MIFLMMIIDLILGVALSLYDSNLLRNIPGFRFLLCHAFTQKSTNALASFLLICISRRWEAEELLRGDSRMMKVEQDAATANKVTSSSVNSMAHQQHRPHQPLLTELLSVRIFRQHLAPLSAVALVQTISPHPPANHCKSNPSLSSRCVSCADQSSWQSSYP